jgi:hypothetical protein
MSDAPNALTPVLAGLQAALVDGAITLTPALIPAGTTQVFLKSLAGGQLQLQAADVISNDPYNPTQIVVTGLQPGPWPIPNVPGIALSGINVKLALTLDAVTGSVMDAFEIPGATISAPNASTKDALLLSGALLPDASFSLQLAAANQANPVVGLAGAIAALSAPSVISLAVQDLPLFNSITISEVVLRFSFVPGVTSSITLGSQLSDSWPIINNGTFKLTLANPSVSVTAQYRPPNALGTIRISSAVRLHADTTIDSAHLAVFVDLGNSDEMTVIVKEAQRLPDLVSMARAVGGDTLRDTVGNARRLIDLGDIEVDAIAVGFIVSTATLTRVTLSGRAVLGDVQIGLTMQLLPDFTISAALQQDVLFPSDRLVQQVLGSAGALPPFKITGLSLFAAPHLQTYSLFVDTTEDCTWNLLDGQLGLRNFGFQAERSANITSGSVFANVTLGGFDIGFSANYRGGHAGWLLSGTGAQPYGVDVGTFLPDVADKLNVTVPRTLLDAVKTLRIVSVAMSVDTSTRAFTFSCDTEVKGEILLGVHTYHLEQRIILSSTIDPGTRKRTVTGHFEAELEIGDAIFTLTYDFGPVKVVTGQWRDTDGSTLDFRDIAKAIADDGDVNTPDGLDLGLKSASFSYDFDAKSFILSGESTTFGDAFFTMKKSNGGGWGFIFGIDSRHSGKLSALPVIGKDLHAVDSITFENVSLLVASESFAGFSVPPLPPLPTPSTSSGGQTEQGLATGRIITPIVSGATLQLQKGFSLAATLDFTRGSTDGRIHRLDDIIATDELLLQVTIAAKDVSLFISLSEKIYVGGGRGRLALSKPTVRIQAGTDLEFQVAGGLLFTVDSTLVNATASLSLSETEAQVAVSLAADQGALPAPPGVSGLHLEQFAVALGVFFEPPGVDLGLQGRFTVGEDTTQQPDQFAFVMALEGDVPNLRYFSFYVDTLDLGEVVTLFTDRNEPAVVQALDIVKGTDLSFTWCEGPVTLPDGSFAPKGFSFSGDLQILSFAAYAELRISATAGVIGNAEMAPIDLGGILQITGDGHGVRRKFQQVGGQWVPAKNNTIVRSDPQLPTRFHVVVPPGGPVVAFNAMHSPFLQVNWKITLFDVVRQTVAVTITTTALTFVLTYEVANIATFGLNCSLTDSAHFGAAANLTIEIKAAVGPIHVLEYDVGTLNLDAGIAATLDITLDPAGFNLELSGGFSFEGLTMTMPTVGVTVAPASLSDLWSMALRAIRQNADQVFADLFATATKWAGMIASGIVTGVTDMAHMLRHAYNVTADQAAVLMSTAKLKADEVAAGLKSAYNVTAHEAAAIMKNAGFLADDVAAGLKSAYGLAEQDTATAMKTAGFLAADVGAAMASAYSAVAQNIATVLRTAGFTGKETGQVLCSQFSLTAVEAGDLLRSVGFAAGDVFDVMTSIYNLPTKAATRLMRDVGFPAALVGLALSASGLNLNQNAVAQYLSAAGFGASDVGGALKTVFSGISAPDITTALKSAGFPVDQTGDFVKQAFDLGPEALNDVLKVAGFVPDQIEDFFNTLGGAFASAVDSVIQHLDPASW